jgi:hypothetical protein
MISSSAEPGSVKAVAPGRKAARRPGTETRRGKPVQGFLSRDERIVAGKALRDAVPRASHTG